jgi:Domain of unknown function (DUF4760)
MSLPLEILLAMVASISGLITAYAQIFLVVLAYRWTREQKRTRTFGVIYALDLGRALVTIEKDPELIKNALHSSDEGVFIREMLDLLNRAEAISLGIRQGFYDEDVLFEYMGTAMVTFFRQSLPFIESMRARSRNASMYINLEAIARRWERRRDFS